MFYRNVFLYYSYILYYVYIQTISLIFIVVKPDLNTHETTVEAYVGKSLQLQCFNSFKPEPTLNWTKLDGEMPEASRINFQYSKSVLMINGAKLSDSGQYKCHAKNEAGEADLILKLIIYGKI